MVKAMKQQDNSPKSKNNSSPNKLEALRDEMTRVTEEFED